MFKTIAIAIAALTLWGCSPPDYDIIFTTQDGQIWFSPRFGGGWPFKWDEKQIEVEYIEVKSKSAVLWSLVPDVKNPACIDAKDRYPRDPVFQFPIRYGSVPHCFVERVKARALPVNTRLRVEATGLNFGTGEFSLVSVIRLQPLEIDYQEKGWPTDQPNWDSLHDYPDANRSPSAASDR